MEQTNAEKIGNLVDESVVALLEQLKAAAYKHDYDGVESFSKALQRILSIQ